MNKKICIIGPGLGMGGIERSSSNIANFFYSEGYQVLFLAIFKHNKFFTLEEGIIYDEPEQGINIKKLNVVRTLQRIRSKIKEYDPEVVLVFNQFYSALTLLALVGTTYRTFTSDRASPLRKWPLLQKIIIDIAFRLNPPTGMIAQTSVAAYYQKKKANRNTAIAVIPNVLRKVTLHPEIKRNCWVLAVGRLNDRAKGFDQLVEAFAIANPKEWKLVFVGGDEEGTSLKQMAKKLEIDKKILFLGKVSEIDIIYAQAGIFVIPSRTEGFPNALCEAMAAGLPCISFDFMAGPRDLIETGKNGIIVEDGNIESLAQAINKLIADEELRNNLGNKAMEVKEKLDRHVIGSRLAQFLLSPKKND